MKLRWGFIALASFLAISPALAAGWSDYDNARFGYTISVPPAFACDPEATDGDGKFCTSADGAATLRFWGGYTGTVATGGFPGEVAFEKQAARQDGLKITYSAEKAGWASYSGTKAGNIVYVRMISGCGDSQYAGFELVYPPSRLAAMKPVVGRLVSSLAQQACDQ